MSRAILPFFMLAACVSDQDAAQFSQGGVSADAEYLEVVTRAADQLQAGTTLVGMAVVDDAFPDGHSVIAEVAADGRILWEYEVAYDIAPPGMLNAVEPTADGTVLFTALGMGVYEVNRAGEIVWSIADQYASHDADRLPNGNTLYTRGIAPEGEALLVEVDPAGAVVWSWDGLDEFSGAPYEGFADELGAWAHPNSVTRLSDGTTQVSLRNFNTIMNVSASGVGSMVMTFEAEESSRSIATEGVALGARPHDPEMLDGHTMLLALRAPHQVVEVDTNTQDVVWRWVLPADAEEDDGAFRDVDRLPNGNTLVTGSRRVYELNSAGEVVWELIAPALPGDNDSDQSRRRAHIFNSTRILPDGSSID